MKVVITVPRVPPSHNELRRKYRHWAVYRNLRRQWDSELWHMASQKDRKELVVERKVRVSIHVEHGGVYDADNLHASAKPILDSLKHLCFIADDSPRWIELCVTQEKSKERRTTITIEDLPE